MMAWRLSELVRCTPGQIVGNDCAFSSVSTDSRTLKPGALFVALSGPSFDGHDFVAAAAERGAAAAIVERPLASQIPQVVTPDPLGALSAFAREWRRQFHIPLIGVTGWQKLIQREFHGNSVGTKRRGGHIFRIGILTGLAVSLAGNGSPIHIRS